MFMVSLLFLAGAVVFFIDYRRERDLGHDRAARARLIYAGLSLAIFVAVLAVGYGGGWELMSGVSEERLREAR